MFIIRFVVCWFLLSLFLQVAVQPPAIAQVPEVPTAAAEPSRVLTFAEAMALAATNNRDLLAARERLRGAHADVEKALAALMPTVSLQSRLSVNYPSVVVALEQADMPTATLVARTQLDGYLNTYVPIVTPSAYPALKGARLSYQAQQKQLEVTAAQVLTSVAATFYAAAGNDELLSARRHAIEVAQKTLDSATARLGAGIASRLDVTRAQLALIQVEQRLLEAQDSRAASYRALATLIRLHGELFRVQPPVEPGGDPGGDVSLVDQALRQRPELLGLQLQSRALGQQVLSSKLRWSPNLSLFGNLRLSNATGFTGQYYSLAVGLQLDWLLFDGFLRDADRHILEAAQRSTLLQMEQLRDTISDDVRNARRTVVTKKQGLATALRAVTMSQEALELVRKQYSAGTATQLDLLNAQDALIQAEVGVAQARFDLSLAMLTLRRLSGDPLGAPPH